VRLQELGAEGRAGLLRIVDRAEKIVGEQLIEAKERGEVAVRGQPKEKSEASTLPAIHRYIAEHNGDPRPFNWTSRPDLHTKLNCLNASVHWRAHPARRKPNARHGAHHNQLDPPRQSLTPFVPG
jgi:hypothetical protein